MIDKQHHSFRAVDKIKNKPTLDINVVMKSKERRHLRGRSDIDSLSPEVRRALHSTFGGKLDEIRSKIRASIPSPPLSPLQSASSSPLPSHPPTPSPLPPSPQPLSLQRTVTERLADREGAHMLVAYFSAILLSSFILSSAGGDDDGQDVAEVCGERISDSCARFYGYILPIGLSSIFFTFALVFFVFDVMFSLFNILTNAEDFYRQRNETEGIVAKQQSQQYGNADKGSDVVKQQSEHNHKKDSWTKQLTESCDNASRNFAAGRLALFFIIDSGFIIAVSALLWISRTSTVDPLYTICEQKLKLLWMFGLMIMAIVVLLSAIEAFKDPPGSNLPLFTNVHILTAFKKVSVIFVLWILCTACYYGLSERQEVPQSVGHHPVEENANRTSLLDAIFGGKVQEQKCCEEFSLLQSSDQPQRLCECPLESDESKSCSQCKVEELSCLDWCEAHYTQSCEWPRAKRIQRYEWKDRCSAALPWCDWPLAKRIQPYEDKNRCAAKNLLQCEWPRVKRIQVYESKDRCKPMVHPECDWPWLKQIEIFRERDRCPAKNTQQCEWPWLKQIQLFHSTDWCWATDHQRCEQSCEANFEVDVCPAISELTRRRLCLD